MKEEEKKAIKSLRIKATYIGDNYNFGVQGIKDLRNELNIVLNLTEKQNEKIEELEVVNKNLDNLAKTMMNNYTKALEDTVKYDYIPKSTIMEKVEELENYIQENSDEQGYWGSKSSDEIYNKIDILKELLGDEDENRN